MKLLIIGDNESSINLIKTVLSSIDFNSPSACLYSEAENKIYQEKPDILLVDISVSTPEGLDMCASLHSLTTIPFIALSVSNDPQYIAGILNAGADDFLVKPISNDMLIAKINKTLRRVNFYSQTIPS
jgi:DNA-binding response OmpR family regulator